MDTKTIEVDGDLEETFDRAAKHFTTLVSSLPQEKLLYFYARYKQATEGDCNNAKPSLLNQSGRRKWEAWKGVSGASKCHAMHEYIAGVQECDPSWCDSETAKEGSGQCWARVSRLPSPEPCTGNSFFDAVQEGSVSGLLSLDLKQLVTERSADGMTGLHWAADRGHCDVAELLLTYGACVDEQDDTGQTPLHYAASCGHRDMVALLLRNGADTTLTDEDGLTAKQVVAYDEGLSGLF